MRRAQRGLANSTRPLAPFGKGRGSSASLGAVNGSQEPDASRGPRPECLGGGRSILPAYQAGWGKGGGGREGRPIFSSECSSGHPVCDQAWLLAASSRFRDAPCSQVTLPTYGLRIKVKGGAPAAMFILVGFLISQCL